MSNQPTDKQPDKQKELKQKMEHFLDRAKNAFSRGRDEVKRVSKIGKLKFDLSALQRQRQRALQALGEKVIKLVDDQQLAPEAVTDDIEVIKLLNQQVDEMEQEIHGLSSGIHEAVKPTTKPFKRD